MRAIWTGAISFGLVNVSVRAYAATEDHDVTLHQVHDADGGRIRYQRRCEVCGKEVAYEHTDRAYADQDRTVVLTDDDLSSLPEERSREIDVMQFVPSEQIDPIVLDRSYFLAPDESALKAYTLLRRTLEESDRTAVVQFTLRRKTRLGVLRPLDDVLLLQAMRWHDEVRQADFPQLEKTPRLSKAERESAKALVDQLSEDFTPERFADEYQDQLKTLVQAKIEQGDALDTDETFGETEEQEENVVDLVEALRRSVEQSQQDSESKRNRSSTRKSDSTSGPNKKKAG